jgi:hypothetical protein
VNGGNTESSREGEKQKMRQGRKQNDEGTGRAVGGRTPLSTKNYRKLNFTLIIFTCSVQILRGADKSLAFLISYFPICSTIKRIFLGWVKEVRTTKP